MNNIKVLHIGIKYWPYNDEVNNNSSLKGIRGGGMNKYCDMLINALPSDVSTVIICQRIKGQKKFETEGSITVYRTLAIGNRANRQIITNLLSFFIALRINKKEEIDIVHGHQQPGIVIAYYLGKLLKKPIVGTPYSFTTVGLNFIYNKICKFIESSYYKKINLLVFESAENRDKAYTLRGLIFPNSVVIQTGIQVPTQIRHLNSKNSFNLLYIGRLVKIKAVENLILSILKLNEEILLKIHLNIAGEGELYDELRSLINDNALNQYITLHGYVEDSSEMFKKSDIFILPSFQEGLSISLLEAMSYGLACIVNNFGVPFPKDTVYEMLNNNPQSIAEAITRIINNDMLFTQLKENARNEIVKNYSVKRFAQNYYNVYKDVINIV
jgi:glycosyltransferase involved in cell wall biosynthesis